MASGWAPDGAEQAQIDASLADALSQVRERIASGESLRECEECGEAIPEARRRAVQGVRLCVQCQAAADKQQRIFAGYNRRGSKDSQLK